jgi:hypothetical protein
MGFGIMGFRGVAVPQSEQHITLGFGVHHVGAIIRLPR